jgi:hypothetical protein
LKPLRVLSLGAGVQSSTVALMMKHGEIEKADVMIFADTVAEPPSVYRWLGWLVSEMAFCIPFVKVQYGDGLTANLERACRGECSGRTPPLFLINPDGSHGMLHRTCTDRFKIRPIEKQIRAMLAKDQTCVSVRGISVDESRRARPSTTKRIEIDYPLVSRAVTRQDCKRWMVSKGYPIPPRSACTFCPYRCNVEWQKMRDLEPEAFAEACRVDDMLRTSLPGIRGVCFVHAQRVPLREAKIEDDTTNRFPGSEGWGVECEGMCGV